MRRGFAFHQPTLELASVKLFNVVLLPLEGLPTNPIRGSRGIVVRRRGFVVVGVHRRGVEPIRNIFLSINFYPAWQI